LFISLYITFNKLFEEIKQTKSINQKV
jgi:hypothetical protein